MVRYQAFIVSDDLAWSERTARACAEIGMIPEHLSWSEASTVESPPAVLTPDVDPAQVGELLILERWARRVWCPICIVSLRAMKGASECQSRLQAVGYRNFVYTASDAPDFAEFQSQARRLLEERCWLVPLAARALGCSHPAVVEALSLAVVIAPEAQTVDRWAREMGLRSRRPLEELFAACHVRNPARVFQWLRLARVVDFAAHQPKRPTRDELATRFGFGSGDYLGKRAKAITGRALGPLLSLRIDSFFELMAMRLSLEP